MKKRILLIKSLGCLMLLIAFFWCFFILNSLDTMQWYPVSAKVLMLFEALIQIGVIIAGILVLRLRELGRKLVILLNICDIPHSLIAAWISNKMIAQIRSESMDYRQLGTMFLSLWMDLFLIYIFTRPRIKEQFQKA